MRQCRPFYCCLIVFGTLFGTVKGAALVNGDFEDSQTSLPGWSIIGNVVAFTNGGNTVARISENVGGQASRLYQVFDLPPNPRNLFFEFRMVAPPGCPPASCPQPCPPGIPADAFIVWLLDPVTLDRIAVPANCPPTNTDGFLWDDNNLSTPAVVCPQFVTVETLAQGWRRVTLDISSLASGQSVRLEYGIADGCDGKNTTVEVDSVLAANYPPNAVCQNVTLEAN